MVSKRWFHTEVGQLVLQQEQLKLAAAMPEYWLSSALQVGIPAGASLLVDLQSLVRLVLAGDTESDATGADLIADPIHLPLDSESVELVVLHHALESSLNPHAVLREASRVVSAGGFLAIFAFNPWSLAGLWHIGLAGMKRRGPCCQFPFIPASHIQDWLSVLGFELLSGSWMLYRPPLMNAWFWQKLRFMENAGDRWWPALGGVSLLVARKQQPGMWYLHDQTSSRRRYRAVLTHSALKPSAALNNR